MVNEYTGAKSSAAGRYAIAVSRYNESITGKLLQGALETLSAAGAAQDDIDVFWSPGAFELPLIAQRLTSTGSYVAVLCLGAVIRGDTTHDQHINRAVSLGLLEASLASGVPVLFGVLTCDTLEQAINRAGGVQGNKGAEAALSALEMADLLRQIDSRAQ